MDVGLYVLQQHLSWDDVRRRAELAASAGCAGVWLFDHLKPLEPDGDGSCLESWTLLSALAATVPAIRLGVLVTPATFRHPSLLAAQVATVDHVSGGRVDVGLGAGWYRAEHEELGIPFPARRERVGMLGETIEVLKLLLTRDGVSFRGRYATLDGATYRPRPVQRPHPPIWVGGTGETGTIPLAARSADVWHGLGKAEDLVRKAGLLSRAAEDAGRDPGTIRRAAGLTVTGGWDRIQRDVETLAAAGFTYVTVTWQPGVSGLLERLVRAVR